MEKRFWFSWGFSRKIRHSFVRVIYVQLINPTTPPLSLLLDPVTDVTDDPSFTKNYPTYGFPNVWPTELPELKEAFMQLGTYIVEVGIMLARHCDRYISAKYPDLPRDLIEKPLSESVKTHKV